MPGFAAIQWVVMSCIRYLFQAYSSIDCLLGGNGLTVCRLRCDFSVGVDFRIHRLLLAHGYTQREIVLEIKQ
jgi:hypothetical protein